MNVANEIVTQWTFCNLLVASFGEPVRIVASVSLAVVQPVCFKGEHVEFLEIIFYVLQL